jgi:phosphatidylinositol dimannoside acyltransferase
VPTARGKLTYAAYRGAAGLAEILPRRAGLALARVAGRVAPHTMRGRNAMAIRHQHRVAGDTADVDTAVRAAWESYARYWYELFRLPAEVRQQTISDHFTIDGWEIIEEGLARGKGVVFALPHLGGWEWGAAWMAMPPRNQHMLAVVEALDPPELFEWFARQREAMGLEVAALGPGVSTRVIKALRDNRIVCLVSDRDLTGDGVEVEFFGERTTLPAGPATLCLRTGATLLPLAVYFRPDGGHHAVIRPPVAAERTGRLRDDVERITQTLAQEFEVLISDAPEQWHLLQPNWPSDVNGTS